MVIKESDSYPDMRSSSNKQYGFRVDEKENIQISSLRKGSSLSKAVSQEQVSISGRGKSGYFLRKEGCQGLKEK